MAVEQQRYRDREPPGRRPAGPGAQHQDRYERPGHPRYPDDRAPAWGYWDDDDQAYPGRQDSATGGAAGNERLTGLTGLALLILLAVEGFTILALRQMLTLHFFVGMLLAGLLLAVLTIHLAGPWAAAPGAGR